MGIVPLPANPDIAPAELPVPDTGPPSSCTIISDFGPSVTIWSTPGTGRSPQTGSEVQLQISPDAPVVIGRQDGGEIEYLDPRYLPSPILPDGRRTILQHDGKHQDIYVSRGHFLLRSHAAGILFVNGVPRRGGGIRPPRNWTQLLAPQQRMLGRGEELLIERGNRITIRLPNETRLTIAAG